MAKVELFYKRKLEINLIAETFEKSFNQEFDSDYWEWRFLNNPNDKKVFISYIIEDNKLAAYYAVSPCIIEIENKKFKIALSNMTMTHPDYRGKGYFKLLAKELYKALKENDYIGVYGFANTNSHYGFRKYLNWKDLSILNNFKVTPRSFREFLLRKQGFSFFESNITKSLLDGIKELETMDFPIMVNRDNANYDWRLCKIPSNKYKSLIIKNGDETIGVIFYKFYGDQIDIMEVLSKNTEGHNGILIEGITFLMEKYKNDINIWSNLYSEEHVLLEKYGFSETTFNTYFGIIPFIDNELLLDIKNWNFRFYDSDVY